MLNVRNGPHSPALGGPAAPAYADGCCSKECRAEPEADVRHQASLWVDYSFPQEAVLGLRIGGGLRYVGSSMAPMNTSTGEQTKVGGYTLLDAAASYDLGAKNPQLQDLVLAISGTNLTDEHYFTPGFYSDSVFYGNRRAVNATLTYKW